VVGLTTAAGNINTPTANASVAVNVGANVNLTTTRINVGNASVNTFITSTAIETDGTLTVLGATTLSNTIAVTGNAAFANTLAVTGNSTFSNIATFKTEHVLDVFANGNLGLTTGSDLLIFEFPKADYSSAKLLIQLKNQGNTQISEVLLAHDTTDTFLTTYGTVSSPASSNAGVSLLGTFSANTVSANVRVYAKQTRANTASKVVAQFIK
jgi:hypothetical protein